MYFSTQSLTFSRLESDVNFGVNGARVSKNHHMKNVVLFILYSMQCFN